MTVDVPEDGSGVKLQIFLVPAASGVVNWGLARKFGPLQGLGTAEGDLQVAAAALDHLASQCYNPEPASMNQRRAARPPVACWHM